MISLIIPAYNEEKRIGPSLRAIKEHLDAQHEGEKEIIVVDDGSRDKTGHVVESLTPDIPELRLIRYETNRGKGYALRTGVLASRGKEVLLTDADLSTPIDELSKILPLVTRREWDIVIGSRALALSNIEIEQPWWRQGMGKIFNRIVKTIVLDDFNDTQCGFKLFDGDVARTIFREARIDRFAYDVEILFLAKKKGFRIKEFPIRWIDSPESRVNPVNDSLRMLVDLIRIRTGL